MFALASYIRVLHFLSHIPYIAHPSVSTCICSHHVFISVILKEYGSQEVIHVYQKFWNFETTDICSKFEKCCRTFHILRPTVFQPYSAVLHFKLFYFQFLSIQVFVFITFYRSLSYSRNDFYIFMFTTKIHHCWNNVTKYIYPIKLIHVSKLTPTSIWTLCSFALT